MNFSVNESANRTGTGGAVAPATTDTQAQNNYSQIAANCMNSTQLIAEAVISFQDPSNLSCNFGQGDNLPARDGYFQGHIDQMQALSLPAGSTLCAMEFQFQNVQMRYDDHFLLTFDNVVIAGTFDFSSELSNLLNLNLYSWDKIRGTPWHTRTNLEGTFCEGSKLGESSCSWPRTDTFGPINMTFNNSVFQKIVALDPMRSNHAFNLITIGDNDNGDCEISPISFNVRVSYVK